MENNKTKRFYKAGEVVWVIGEKKEGVIESIDKDNLEVKVKVEKGEHKGEKYYALHTLKLWEIDKLKYKAKDKLVKEKRNKSKVPTVYFAKVRPDAIIPSKRDEDAGYDIYANIQGVEVESEGETKVVRELYVPANQTTLVPTGIAMALPKTHYFNCKHERGSTGKISMSVLAGVVDSGYRGEIFIALTPLHKDILITSEVEDVEVGEHVILYPYTKAIAQATIDLVPKVNIKEIPFEELQNIESERGDTKLGQSGK